MFEQIMEFDAAHKEVMALLAKKKLFPKRIEKLAGAIEAVAEAISFGFVVINEDGSITQKLVEPIMNQGGGVALAELSYKARIEPSVMNAKVSAAKPAGPDEKIMTYAVAYTGQVSAMINKLDQTDRNTCDAISLFFM